MKKQIIATDKAPAAVGPYSQAVRVGDLIYTAGQIGLIPGTREFAGSDISAKRAEHCRTSRRSWRLPGRAWTMWSRRRCSWWISRSGRR